jgi:hypothetical protein
MEVNHRPGASRSLPAPWKRTTARDVLGPRGFVGVYRCTRRGPMHPRCQRVLNTSALRVTGAGLPFTTADGRAGPP